MDDVRLVDLDVIKRYSLAIRQETAPAEEVLAALDASRAQVEAHVEARVAARVAAQAQAPRQAQAQAPRSTGHRTRTRARRPAP